MKKRDRWILVTVSAVVFAAGGGALHEHLQAEPRAGGGDPASTSGGHAISSQPQDRGNSRQAEEERYRKLAAKLLAEMDEPGEGGHSSFQLTIGSLSQQDLAALLAELRGRSRSADEGRLFVRLMQAWAEKDPEMASSALESEDDSEAYRKVASVWARKSMEDAAAWIRSLTDPGNREQAWIGLGSEVALTHPQQAIEFARAAGVTPDCSDFVQLAAAAWAEKDAGAAVEWAKQVEDVALREQLLAGIAISWADTDPSAAAGLIFDSVEGGMLEENVLVGIVQRIALRDQSSARGWVEQFPEGRMRERAEAELARISERMGRVAGSTGNP